MPVRNTFEIVIPAPVPVSPIDDRTTGKFQPRVICHAVCMKADRVEVSRDEKGSWLIRIQVGEEVIRRHCREPKNADESTLRDAAMKTVTDEGYTVDPSSVVVSV
jgi:hypothetical protein